MSWVAIAKKDVQDSVRSRTLWALIAVFLLLIVLLANLVVPGDISDTATLLAAISGTFLFGILFFVPLMGLIISIKSVVRERESGTINLLLALPHSRRDLVLGKFVGRSIVLSIAIVATFLPATLYILVQADITPIFEMFAFLLSTILFGMMFVGIGVALSALVNSETQAAISGVVIFFLLYLWPVIFDQLGISISDFVARFWLFSMFIDMLLALFSLRHSDIPNASLVAWDNAQIDEFGAITIDVAVYMQHWFVFIILAIWIAVPLGIGYFRFDSIDL